MIGIYLPIVGGARTRSRERVCLLFCALPATISAQETKSSPAVPSNDTQILGRRVFQQRCAVCHTETVMGARRYGPALYEELIVGNEDSIREFIANGSKGKMPGFKYGLTPTEINSIVEYLKTLRRPVKRSGPAEEGSGE